jgi:hypothetical protein
MHLDAEDLLARIRRDFPEAYELCQLRQLVDVQQAEIERLNALVAPGFDPNSPRPYLGEEGRHG